MKIKNKYRFLFAGGGTGGHLFPAVAVAEKIKSILPEADILFVGTKSRIEGRVVPKLGYKFKSIWIKGFSRKLTVENLLFPLKLIVSVIQSIIISMKFKPKVAIGSGGYVSGPAIFGSSVTGAKIILIEQNSYPGVTTKMLERFAEEIHISFDDSKKFFKDKNKLLLTGNPVRGNLTRMNKEDARQFFGLSGTGKTLLVLGGSLGAASLNQAVSHCINKLKEKKIQLIWQTGKNYFEKYKSHFDDGVFINSFIDDMNKAYAACDLLVSRSGATTIAEIVTLGIPSILVPSPNVAENHQFYNAKSLTDNNAAVLLEDKIVEEKLFEEIEKLIFNSTQLEKLSSNAKALGKPDAAYIIAKNAIKYAEAV
jgi:UDP-N-acetylglucosamine--N-acetylmuramyl-(pentapeptide) pyrophosphoryl-undecaprenol N-acetylglucosamine transferase